MTPDERACLLAALRTAKATVASIEAALARDGASPVPAGMVPLAVACRAWNVSKDTGIKRARRGQGRKIAGRWHVSARDLPPLEDP
jgi:hypothetical protein